MTPDSLPRRPHLGHSSDAELVRELARGSRQALGTLFGRHKDVVYRLAYRITGSAQDAEDVLQDVFVGLGRALDRYEERGRFASWICGIAARVALMRMRSLGHRRTDSMTARADLAAPVGPDVVERIAMQRLLELMPETSRIVFLLKEVEGYSHAEIAALLDIGVSASKVRLHRAWRFLERHMGEDR